MSQARLRSATTSHWLARAHSIVKVIGTFLVQFVFIAWFFLFFVSTPVLGMLSLAFFLVISIFSVSAPFFVRST